MGLGKLSFVSSLLLGICAGAEYGSTRQSPGPRAPPSPSHPHAPPPEPRGNSVPHVALSQGVVEGFRDSSNNSVFLGIPFAATTGGQNR